jgi:DNA polymerase-1
MFNRLYLIDAVNVLFRSYYAIKGMTNPKGQSTNALYGFIRSIYKLMNDFSADHVVAVFDGPDNKQLRTAIYSEYKAHREGMPEDLYPQLEWAIQFCEIAGIPYLCIPGFEADDVIGSIAKWAEKQGIETFICSSDKDMSQLVTDKTFVINIGKDNLLIDRNKVKELFGVTPEQITDWLGMMGDTSDNIPGLEGFGPKTAAQLLEEFGSLENILANPDKIKGLKKQEIIRQGKAVALMSKQLATIHTSVEFPEEEIFFCLKAPDLEKVHAFYQEMRFTSLLKELDAAEAAKQGLSSNEPEEVNYLLVDEEQELLDLIYDLMQESEICLDTETTDLKPMQAKLVGIGIGISPKKAWYIPLNGKLGRKKVLDLIRPLFESPKVAFYGHNIKYDLHVLLNEGLPLPRLCFDTMLASYLVTPQNHRHGLDQLSIEKFSKVKIPIEDLIGKGKNQLSMLDVPIEKVKHYCCEDVDMTCRLKKLFEEELEKHDLTSLFTTIELPLIPVLLSMERKGIFVDTADLRQMSDMLARELAILEQEITDLAGEAFNLNSPKQLSTILFEKLKLRPPKKTTTGFSTSADVLESLKGESPIIEKILSYRTLEKLRSTYVDSLPEQINPQTHRIHCTFNQSVAATGRLSCQDPNLQNIPIRSEAGRKIRTAFKPQHPHTSFIAGDYSQIELRLLAHLSGDPELIKAFHLGEDIHAYTASLVFEVPLVEVTSEMRSQAKAVNFGILYGQQAFGLSQGLGIDFKAAATFIETYFERYQKVKEYLDSCKEAARRTGYAITMTGRKRPIPEIHSTNPALRNAAERLAINTPLQGTAADLIKIAMIQIEEKLKEKPSLGSMILQIHDELLFEVPDSSLAQMEFIIKSMMESVFTLKVPLIVDISIGKNWGEC